MRYRINAGRAVREWGGVVKCGHEAVALAFAMRIGGQSFVLIMDDAGGRRMVRHHFAHLARFMTGTAGFVAIL